MHLSGLVICVTPLSRLRTVSNITSSIASTAKTHIDRSRRELVPWFGINLGWSHPEADFETKVRISEGGNFWEHFRELSKQDRKGCKTKRRWLKE